MIGQTLYIQTAYNALSAAGIYLLVALGFSLIYGTMRFFHFAHGAVYAYGSYFCYALLTTGKFPLLLAIAVAVPLAGMLGCALEFMLYRPLRRRSATPLVLFLASLGAYIVIQNSLSLIFGDDAKSLNGGGSNESIEILGGVLTPVQLTIATTATALSVGVALLLNRTRTGAIVRAVANDTDLAQLSGINSNHVYLVVLFVGSALAAVASILSALDTNLTPSMGMNALMMGIVVVIVGGTNSVWGLALVSLFFAVIQHFGMLIIGAQWKDAIAFVMLSLTLIIRPSGIFGLPSKRAAI